MVLELRNGIHIYKYQICSLTNSFKQLLFTAHCSLLTIHYSLLTSTSFTNNLDSAKFKKMPFVSFVTNVTLIVLKF